jgi:hypothetical protein
LNAIADYVLWFVVAYILVLAADRVVTSGKRAWR